MYSTKKWTSQSHSKAKTAKEVIVKSQKKITARSIEKRKVTLRNTNIKLKI